MNNRIPEVIPTIVMSRDIGRFFEEACFDVDAQGIARYLSDRGLTDEEIECLTIEFATEKQDYIEGLTFRGQYMAKDDKVTVYMNPVLDKVHDVIMENFDEDDEDSVQRRVKREVDDFVTELNLDARSEVTDALVNIRVSQIKYALTEHMYERPLKNMDSTIAHELEHRLLRDDEILKGAKRQHDREGMKKILPRLVSRGALFVANFSGATYVSSLDTVRNVVESPELLTVTPSQAIGSLAVFVALGKITRPINRKMELSADFEYAHYLSDPEEKLARAVGHKNTQQFVSLAPKAVAK